MWTFHILIIDVAAVFSILSRSMRNAEFDKEYVLSNFSFITANRLEQSHAIFLDETIPMETLVNRLG